MHADDERALKLTRAFQTYNLHAVLDLLRTQLTRSYIQTRTNLRPIFEHAQHDHLNLLNPPSHFHAWLQKPLHANQRAATPAKPNTIIARLSTLTRLYDLLIDEGLLTTNPAHGYPAPSGEHKDNPLPDPQQIRRLLLHARESDPALYAALTLIYTHAFQIAELTRLRWNALDFSRGELLRARTVSPLHPEALQALDPLLRQAGGPLHTQDDPSPVFPYRTSDDLRLLLWRTCKNANLPSINPSDLRAAGLRDHPPVHDQAGFRNPQAYRRALKYAQQVTRKTRA